MKPNHLDYVSIPCLVLSVILAGVQPHLIAGTLLVAGCVLVLARIITDRRGKDEPPKQLKFIEDS